MFSRGKKKQAGEKLVFSIQGMHCTSCSMNIDGELEDATGILDSSTSYAKATTEVHYDPESISPAKIQQIIEDLGYTSKAN